MPSGEILKAGTALSDALAASRWQSDIPCRELSLRSRLVLRTRTLAYESRMVIDFDPPSNKRRFFRQQNKQIAGQESMWALYEPGSASDVVLAI
jgi:hypothetical protein